MSQDDSLVTVLLVSRLCAKDVQPLKASDFWSLLDLINACPAAGGEVGAGDGSGEHPERDGRRGDCPPADIGPGALVGLSVDRLVRDLCLPEDLAGRVAGLTGRATTVAFELDRLEQSGIRTLTVFDEQYPKRWRSRLGRRAPPLVHGAGSVELLDTPGLGVVGSRDVSRQGGEAAGEIARLAARRGLPLVSGAARGVDQIAMDAACEAGGAVVGILAESLSRKVKRPDVRRAIYDDAALMCTPYSPTAPFSTGNAMGRNKLIYAQAALTVVVASDDGTGGTWSGSTEALKHGYGTVAVWRGDGEGPGNELLEQRGALPVSSLEDIESLLDGEQAPPAGSPLASQSHTEQQSLFAATPPR